MAGPREQPLPPDVIGREEATEVLRAFVVDGGLSIAFTRAFEEPDMWGLLLVDIARHAARAYARASAYSEEEAWIHLANLREAMKKAGRDDEEGFSIYMSLNEAPNVDLYRRFADAGVTDIVCAPWMFVDVMPGTPNHEALAARLGAVQWFADDIIAKI